jgi:hypothetical protein
LPLERALYLPGARLSCEYRQLARERLFVIALMSRLKFLEVRSGVNRLYRMGLLLDDDHLYDWVIRLH